MEQALAENKQLWALKKEFFEQNAQLKSLLNEANSLVEVVKVWLLACIHT